MIDANMSLIRFQRQQTCPTCRLDVLRAAPAAGPTPPQPAQVHN